MLYTRILTVLLVGLSTLLLGSFAASANPSSNSAQYEFETDAQERQFRQLVNELRCPKCQNQSIADSDAPLAVDLRDRVYLMTMEGQSREDIIEFMRVRYGDFVHYKPPVNASTLILWVGPAAVLLGGVLTIVLMTRRQRRSVDLSADEQARLDALLNADDSEQAKEQRK